MAHPAWSRSKNVSSGSSRQAEEAKQNVPNPLQYTVYGMQPDCTLILCSSSAAGVARKWKPLDTDSGNVVKMQKSSQTM